jgi:hypothetical protein
VLEVHSGAGGYILLKKIAAHCRDNKEKKNTQAADNL